VGDCNGDREITSGEGEVGTEDVERLDNDLLEIGENLLLGEF
jgi:hypothetical protein